MKGMVPMLMRRELRRSDTRAQADREKEEGASDTGWFEG
jgi:hypothetical protein